MLSAAWILAFNYWGRLEFLAAEIAAGPTPNQACLERTMGPRSEPTLTVRLLNQRRDELLGELRVLAPELVEKLEQTLEALKEQKPERGRV